MKENHEIPEHLKGPLGLHLIERKKYLEELNHIDHVIYKAAQEKNSLENDLYEFDCDFRAKFKDDERVLLTNYMSELFRFMNRQ
jgi:uncharacterized tellurite resistance protein B-like protein